MLKKCLLSALMVTGLAVHSRAQPMQIVFSVGAGNTVELPLYGTVACTVDWGDGSSPDTVITSGGLQHTFGSAGICTVTVTGSLDTLGKGSSSWTGVDKLTSVISFGDLGITSLTGAFNDADYLISVPGILPTTVTDLSFLFHNMDRDSITNLESWDVSSVLYMNDMFWNAANFDQDIGGWDVGSVTDMSGMFSDAPVFNQDIGNWDVGSVTDMAAMFAMADAFNQDLNSWNVGLVTDMSYMFYGALVFNGAIGNWDVSSVNNMVSMFHYASAFNQDIGDWNVGSVTSMYYMFSNTSVFNQDIGGWDVSSVWNMSYLFNNAKAFDQNIGSWDMNSVTNILNMFSGATLSTANYDSLLIGWEAGGVQSGIEFDGGNSLYSGASADARQRLVNDNGWTITDGGLDPLPVELSSFTASLSGSGVLLAWSTVSEQDNLGFHVLRSGEEAGPYTRVSSSLIPGSGTTNVPQDYEYRDTVPAGGGYYYVLEQVDYNGTVTRSEPVYMEMTVTGFNELISVQGLEPVVPGRSYNLQGREVSGYVGRRQHGIIISIDANGNAVKRLRLE